MEDPAVGKMASFELELAVFEKDRAQPLLFG